MSHKLAQIFTNYFLWEWKEISVLIRLTMKKMVQWINAVGTETKNIKKQPFSDASASHLSLVLWHV